MSIKREKKRKVIIVGAGFAGMQLAKKLNKQPFDVLLIDQQNYHTFQPLLYQVATCGLEPDSITYPVRRALRGFANVRFQMASVESVHPASKQITTSMGILDYDCLVIATGSKNNFFNFDATSNQLLPLKSVTDALNIRSFLLQNLEQAVGTISSSSRSELINIAIIGGGPAGVELAGALGEMKRYVLPQDFPQLDIDTMSITLFEASPRLLLNMSDEASQHCLRFLQKVGVDVKLNTPVKNYDNHQLYLADGSTFPTHSVIWTAGVKGNPLPGVAMDTLTASQRIPVNEYFQVAGSRDIFAIGDVAAGISVNDAKGLPMLAAVAAQQANYLAKNLVAITHGELPTPFVYQDRGVMATIGRNKAVADLPRWKFQGTFAWFVWMFVHIMSLVGFRNKFVTIIGWTFNYLSYDRPLGLIIRPYKKPVNSQPNSDSEAP